MTHPLTDEIISNQFGRYDGIDNVMVYDEDDIRAAANWQLDTVLKWLYENLCYYAESDYHSEMAQLNLKEEMRPHKINL